MRTLQQKLGRSAGVFALLLFFSVSYLTANTVWAGDSQIQEKDLNPNSSSDASVSSSDVSSENPKKGGIYKVGRAFKTAGHGMKKGFVVTGRAFKKAGGAIKNFFTGGSSDQGSKDSVGDRPQAFEGSGSRLDHVGDEP